MRSKQIGVTLMELLTVLVIIGILAGIAIPSYRQYTIRANRTEAKTALLSFAVALERCYTRYNSYVYNPDPALGCTVAFPQNTENGFYRITVAPLAPSTDLTRSFVLTATPQGKQAADTGCGNLTLDSLNSKNRSGTKSIADCWGK